MFFVPIFVLSGKRYKIRCRFVSWRGFHKHRDVFEQGEVYRFWIGFLLVTAMVDTAKG
jgi:hypothetical protein